MCLTTQRSPSRLHRPSPKPPSESNSQDRNCRASGSQPIRWLTVITVLPATLDRERADQEVPVLRPSAVDPDLGVGALVDPLADHPFQVLEPVVGADERVGLLADAGDQPAAVALDEQHRVPARLGRPLVGRDRRSSLLLGDVRAEEPDRLDLDRDLHARAGGERLGEPPLDQLAALVARAVRLDDLRVLGEQGGQGLAVALVVVADERLIGLPDRLLLGGLRRCDDGGLSGPGSRGLPLLGQHHTGYRRGPGRSRQVAFSSVELSARFENVSLRATSDAPRRDGRFLSRGFSSMVACDTRSAGVFLG